MSTLPSTWIETNLGAVVPYGSTVKAEPEELRPETWVLELEDIEKDSTKVRQRLTFADRQSKSTKNRFEASDVLYGKLRPYLNKVIFADQPGVCTTEIMPIKPTEAVNGRYLFHWLRHPRFLAYVTDVSHGVNMPRLGTEAGRQAPFVLAPKNEQKRIADKLDTVLSRVDAVNARLARVSVILKRFRQSVLAAATSGRLTEDWRRGNAEMDLARAIDELGKIFGAPKSQGPFLTTKGSAPYFTETRQLSSLGQVSGGLTKNSSRNDLPLRAPYLRVANVYANDLRLDDISEIGITDAELNKTRLKAGDLLLVEGNGSLDQIGRVAMWDGSIEDCSHQNHLIRWRAGHQINPRFVLFYLLSPVGRAQIEKVAKSTSGLHTLSVSKVAALSLNVPGVEEQEEIVRRVETLFAFADRIEARLKAAQTATERLTPALLSKAFRGELVPQDPNDEPATELLRRLAQVTPAGKSRGRRKAAVSA